MTSAGMDCLVEALKAVRADSANCVNCALEASAVIGPRLWLEGGGSV